MGILDQDVSDKVSLAVPQLYRRGIERKEWTQRKFWTYMVDGLYQSVLVYYFAYLNFRPANFLTESGQGIGDYKRMGTYIANPAVVIVNTYILMNTYRWDWFMGLITTISALLIFFWTGVYTAFTSGFTFYQAAPEVYGNLSFWCNFLLTVIMCLLPRFTAKSFQKMYRPRDVDIVREQIRQGKFEYLKEVEPDHINPMPEKMVTDSASSSNSPKQGPNGHPVGMSDDTRPIYPPSTAATATTHTGHGGSDGTEYTNHPASLRASLDRQFGSPVGGRTDKTDLTTPITPTINADDDLMNAPTPTLERPRPSYERPMRPSFERFRSSMDRTRPSFEASNDFTSAAYLTRVESTQSGSKMQPTSSRRQDISSSLR